MNSSILDYISKDYSVQIVFIIAIAAIIFMCLVFTNIRKVQKLDHDLRVIEPPKRNLPVVNRDDE